MLKEHSRLPGTALRVSQKRCCTGGQVANKGGLLWQSWAGDGAGRELGRKAMPPKDVCKGAPPHQIGFKMTIASWWLF